MRRGISFFLLSLFLLTACGAVLREAETASAGTQYHEERAENGAQDTEEEREVSKEAASEAAPKLDGDSVFFGAFPQRNDAPEPIEWLVLARQDDRALLLSKHCLASLPWHNSAVPATWDTCNLRTWLNQDFLEAAFTEDERSVILTSSLDNGDDFGCGTPVGANTQDKIFLLSGAEVSQYLTDSSLRVVKPTAYAVSQGAYTNGSGECAWWLRSPGMNDTSPAYLSSAGEIGSRAHEASERIIGVRPAMWIHTGASAERPKGEDAYPISLKECTQETITISLDTASADALLLLSSYDKDGRMLTCAVTDQTVVPGASAALSVAYSEDIHHIKAIVLAPDSFSPLRKMWTASIPMLNNREMPRAVPGQTTSQRSIYVDQNGDTAVISADFSVSDRIDEQTIRTGLVIIGPDESEYVWIPATETNFARRDFGSYFSATPFSSYRDEMELESYRAMTSSVERYGGFYMGRYEASFGGGDSIADYVPASRRVSDVESGRIWVQFSPQDTVTVCENMYAGNHTVRGFFPWGVNWDTMLQWLIDSGCKTEQEVASDSTAWGNYSDDSFSPNASGRYTGRWEEAKANNLYDLAGNNWEWTQERYGSDNYVMRGGGYSLMGGSCSGSRYPAALRDPLPGNNHHPNVTFRPALYLTESGTPEESSS